MRVAGHPSLQQKTAMANSKYSVPKFTIFYIDSVDSAHSDFTSKSGPVPLFLTNYFFTIYWTYSKALITSKVRYPQLYAVYPPHEDFGSPEWPQNSLT